MTRRLGVFDAIMIMVGMVIGSAIFLSTGIVAASIPSAGLILLAWLVGGLLTLAGAFTYAELGAAMPEAGGQYVYIHKAYGELPAFLFGWVFFLAYMTGAVASLALAFAEYWAYLFPRVALDRRAVGILVIVILTYVNVRGVGLGKTVQNVLTIVKLATILGFVGLVLTVGETTPLDFMEPSRTMSVSQWALGFVVALVAVSWTFDGWNNINFLAGEIKSPERTITITLVAGTVAITVIYLVMNLVYLMAVPVEELAGVVRVAEVAASASLGERAGTYISAAVLISVVGALNATILAGARVYYAMAMDGLFFASAARVHPTYETPSGALVLQALWSTVLLMSGSLEQIVTYSIFVGIVFWIVAAASLFTLRRKFPELPRPYKAWGYPVVPALFIVASAGILVSTLVEKPAESLASLGIIILGLPAYWGWKHRRSAAH